MPRCRVLDFLRFRTTYNTVDIAITATTVIVRPKSKGRFVPKKPSFLVKGKARGDIRGHTSESSSEIE